MADVSKSFAIKQQNIRRWGEITLIIIQAYFQVLKTISSFNLFLTIFTIEWQPWCVLISTENWSIGFVSYSFSKDAWISNVPLTSYNVHLNIRLSIQHGDIRIFFAAVFYFVYWGLWGEGGGLSKHLFWLLTHISSYNYD